MEDIRGLKLGILLTTDPRHENTQTVIRLSETALARGAEVHIFLMCNGVYHAQDNRFQELAKLGAQLTVCGHNAKQRGVVKQPPCTFGSQYDLAQIVSRVDRFLAFN